MNGRSSLVPDLQLEKLALGELEAAEAERLRAVMESDAVLKSRLARLKESDREILAKYEPSNMAWRIAQRAHSARESASLRRPFALPWPVLVSVPMAAAVALLLVFSPVAPRPETVPGLEPTRIKGESAPALFVYRQAGSSEELLVDGQSAGAGDVLQLRYAGRGRKYGLIFSVDGRGEVTRHLPREGSQAQALESKGAGTLPMSYVLDDAPVMERFYFVAAQSRFSVDEVLASAEELAAGRGRELVLPPDSATVTFTVMKR